MEADRQDYGTAGERAAHFFDEVALMAEQAEDDGKTDAVLQHVLAPRDELIAGLATAQPSAAERLKQLYLELFAMAWIQLEQAILPRTDRRDSSITSRDRDPSGFILGLDGDGPEVFEAQVDFIQDGIPIAMGVC